ncbi:MAG: T9SS type A sorting domain-containing protein [Chlorobi bacterium]|nr:T9SS type A sorting domain-containing protein [Chlorobiota bacterium]
MKKLIALFLLSFFTLSLPAQTIQVFYDEEGNPSRMKIFDEHHVKKIILDKLPENGRVNFIFNGEHVSVDLNSFCNLPQNNNRNAQDDEMEYIEPGVLPEGDLISTLKYTPDSSLLAVVCFNSGNVYFYDAGTFEIVAIVNVCVGARDIAFGGGKAFVVCKTDQEVNVVNLEDFSLENSFPIRENACQIESKSDGSMVYVAFFSWLNGGIGAYNPENGNEIFYTEEPYIHRYSTIGELQGRILDQTVRFVLSPNDEIIVCPNTPDPKGHDPTLFDAGNGHPIWVITPDSYRGAAFSPNGDTLFVLTDESGYTPVITLWRVNCNDYTVIDTLVTNMPDFIDYSDLAMNDDRTKILAVDDWNDLYYYFDLETHTCDHIADPFVAEGPTILSAPEKNLAFPFMFYTYRVFDLDSGKVHQTISNLYNKEAIGTVSPGSEKLLVLNIPGFLLINNQKNEGFYVYDIISKDSVVFDTAIVAGVLPEADGTTSAVLSNDGTKLYATNKVSANFSIIDYATGELDTLIPDMDYTDVKTIPNSDLLFLTGHPLSKNILYDPVNFEIKAEFLISDLTESYISPEGDYIYVRKIGKNVSKIFKIRQDGENSYIEDQLLFSSKNCTFVTSQYRLLSRPELSPDGKYFIYGTEDEEAGTDLIGIISTDSMKVVATLPYETGGCVAGAIFSADMKRALVLDLSFDKYIKKPIVYLDGENSYIESEVNNMQAAFSGQYNEEDSLFYLLLMNNYLLKVDPVNGDIIEKVMTDVDYQWQMVLDDKNIPIIRQYSNILYDDNFYPIPGISNPFFYSEPYDLCIIPSPGPDAICVFNPLTVSIETFPKKHVAGDDWQLLPNPASDKITVSAEIPFQKIEIFDVRGKMVYSGDFNNLKTTIPVYELKLGVYFVNVYFGERKNTKKLVVSR